MRSSSCSRRPRLAHAQGITNPAEHPAPITVTIDGQTYHDGLDTLPGYDDEACTPIPNVQYDFAEQPDPVLRRRRRAAQDRALDRVGADQLLRDLAGAAATPATPTATPDTRPATASRPPPTTRRPSSSATTSPSTHESPPRRARPPRARPRRATSTKSPSTNKNRRPSSPTTKQLHDQELRRRRARATNEPFVAASTSQADHLVAPPTKSGTSTASSTNSSTRRTTPRPPPRLATVRRRTPPARLLPPATSAPASGARDARGRGRAASTPSPADRDEVQAGERAPGRRRRRGRHPPRRRRNPRGALRRGRLRPRCSAASPVARHSVGADPATHIHTTQTDRRGRQ